ncbi:MAG: hypothetical protein ABSC53_03050 [Bacteroidota bacterium]
MSDCRPYYLWAQNNVETETFYPSRLNNDLQREGVVAPVYINMEIVVLKLWNNPKAIFLLNALLNISQLILVFFITRAIHGELAATIAGGLYIIYLNNLGLVLLNFAELAFGVFLLLSVFLLITQRKLIFLLLSGFSLGLAIGIRPTGLAFIAALGIITIWKIFHKKFESKKLLPFTVGFFIYILIAGFYTKYTIDDFLFMSTSGPPNILLSTGDSANGKFNESVLNRPELQRSTYKERNRAFLSYAVQWIQQHPFQWIGEFPQKIYSTYITDDIAISQLLLTQQWSFDRYVKAYRRDELGQEFNLEPFWFRVAFLFLNVFHQLFYLLLITLFILQTYVFFKQRTWSEETVLLYFIIFIGASMTLLSSIGCLRYKYNFIIISMILSSPSLVPIFYKRKH